MPPAAGVCVGSSAFTPSTVARAAYAIALQLLTTCTTTTPPPHTHPNPTYLDVSESLLVEPLLLQRLCATAQRLAAAGGRLQRHTALLDSILVPEGVLYCVGVGVGGWQHERRTDR